MSKADYPDALELQLPIDAEVKKDAGAHYRFQYRGLKIDPYRISQIYGMTDFCMMTILKKCLCAGNRGHKDLQQDLKDIICAAQRKLEMLKEDEESKYDSR